MSTLVKDLTALLSSEQVSTNETVLHQHGQDESYHEVAEPEVVVFPKDTEEVSAILRYANEHRIPV
ncbi:MAG TPA: 2-hydroxy-acid oxidase, partial [Savagea sp.]